MHVTLRYCSLDTKPAGMLFSGDGLHAVLGRCSARFIIIYQYHVAQIHNTLLILLHIIYVFANGDVKRFVIDQYSWPNCVALACSRKIYKTQKYKNEKGADS